MTHDPARFIALLTGSQEERDAAPAIPHTELPDQTLALLDGYGPTVVSMGAFREDYMGAYGIIATLDLRALLEERERMRKALEGLSEFRPNPITKEALEAVRIVARSGLWGDAQEPGT
jgi:hypothetical protein